MKLAVIQHAPYAIFIVAGLAIAGIIFAIPITHWVSQKMTNFLSFFSQERFRKPPPLLSQGDALAMRGELMPAFHLLRKFLNEHPRDHDIYSRLIDLAFGPLQDEKLGDAVLAFGNKHLDRRGRRILKERRNAIVLGELYPLKHLGWRKEVEALHPQVRIPEELKGQFAPPASES